MENTKEILDKALTDSASNPRFGDLLGALITAAGTDTQHLNSSLGYKESYETSISLMRRNIQPANYEFIDRIVKQNPLKLPTDAEDKVEEKYQELLYQRANLMYPSQSNVRRQALDAMAEAEVHPATNNIGTVVKKMLPHLSPKTIFEHMSAIAGETGTELTAKSPYSRMDLQLNGLLSVKPEEADLLIKTAGALTGLSEGELAPLARQPLMRLKPFAEFKAAFQDLRESYVHKNGETHISQAQLSRNTIPELGTEPQLPSGSISSIENGYTLPSVDNLRAAVIGFRKDNQLEPAILEKKLDKLVQAAGWTMQDLFANVEQAVMSAPEDRSIGRHLLGIRQATDVAMTQEKTAELMGVRRDIYQKYEGEKLVPVPQQVETLIEKINAQSPSQESPRLSADAVAKIKSVAARDYAAWKDRPYAERAAQQLGRGEDKLRQ